VEKDLNNHTKKRDNIVFVDLSVSKPKATCVESAVRKEGHVVNQLLIFFCNTLFSQHSIHVLLKNWLG